MSDRKDRDRTCIVCYREARYFSVGSCDHSICFECSARMIVLIENNDCGICRKTLDFVIFVKGKKSFTMLQSKLPMFTFLPKYGIYLENDEIKQNFDELLSYKCTFCDERPHFNDFEEMRMHMNRIHQRFYCDLCVEFIRHFPKERRAYSKVDLATHKRIGDKNDKSQKGHPLCKFCDQRYFDSDELYKHLRKDHYFCHFCDSEGFNQYYNTYDDLRIHFRREHFLCEEEHCKDEKFTSVFRSEIDLKAHLTTVHSKLLGKHGLLKETRRLEIEFSAPSRIEEHKNRRFQNQKRDRDRDRDRDRNRDENDGQNPDELEVNQLDAPKPQPQPELSSTMEFPTLAGGAPPSQFPANFNNNHNHKPSTTSSIAQKVALSSGKNVSSGGGAASLMAKANSSKSNGNNNNMYKPSWNCKVTGSNKLDEEFPQLGGSTGNTYSIGNHSTFPAKISTIQPKPASTTTTTTSTSTAAKFSAPNNLKDKSEFPSLSSGKNPNSSQQQQNMQWAGKIKSNTQQPAKNKKVAPCPDFSESYEYDPELAELSNLNNAGYTFVPLTAGRNKKDHVKFNDEVNNSNSLADYEQESEKAIKKKKKNSNKEANKSSVSYAADTLFNSGVKNIQQSVVSSSSTSSSSNKKKEESMPMPMPTGDDFPSLEPLKKAIPTITSSNKPPPGFNTAPPPGFTNSSSSSSKPLLNLSVNGVISNNIVSKKPTKASAMMNSSVYSKALKTEQDEIDLYLKKLGEKEKPAIYSQPPDFTQRNALLFEKIQVSLDRDESSSDLFRDFSNKYRKCEMSPEEYHSVIRDILGPRDFSSILPELLALLPSIERQHQLLYIHRVKGGQLSSTLEACSECLQLLRPGDINFHLKNSHTPEEAFPSLK